MIRAQYLTKKIKYTGNTKSFLLKYTGNLFLFHQSPIRHSDYTVTDSDIVVTIATDSLVTLLLAVNNSDYTVTVYA